MTFSPQSFRRGRAWALSINFEVQQSASSRIAFLRGAVAEPFTRPGVELRGDPIAVVLRQVRHALFLEEILLDQAVLRTIATTASWPTSSILTGLPRHRTPTL